MGSLGVSIPPVGVFVSSPTFFCPSPKDANALEHVIDGEAQLQHSILIAKGGARGVVLLGSIGEAIHLTRRERIDLISYVAKGLADAGLPDFPIAAGVLTSSVPETLDALNDLVEAGAHWGVVVTPGYFGKSVSQTNLLEYYTLVADRSPVPIMIYNCPAFTNQLTVEPDTMKKLSHHPNIVGCKLTYNDVSAHIQITADPDIDHSKFRVYSGFSQQLAPVVLFGAAGVVDGLAGVYPKTVARVMELAQTVPVQEGALREMREIQFAISRGKSFFAKTGLMGIREAITRKYGIGTLGGSRLPMKGINIPGADWDRLYGPLMQNLEDIEARL